MKRRAFLKAIETAASLPILSTVTADWAGNGVPLNVAAPGFIDTTAQILFVDGGVERVAHGERAW